MHHFLGSKLGYYYIFSIVSLHTQNKTVKNFKYLLLQICNKKKKIGLLFKLSDASLAAVCFFSVVCISLLVQYNKDIVQIIY